VCVARIGGGTCLASPSFQSAVAVRAPWRGPFGEGFCGARCQHRGGIVRFAPVCGCANAPECRWGAVSFDGSKCTLQVPAVSVTVSPRSRTVSLSRWCGAGCDTIHPAEGMNCHHPVAAVSRACSMRRWCLVSRGRPGGTQGLTARLAGSARSPPACDHQPGLGAPLGCFRPGGAAACGGCWCCWPSWSFSTECATGRAR